MLLLWKTFSCLYKSLVRSVWGLTSLSFCSCFFTKQQCSWKVLFRVIQLTIFQWTLSLFYLLFPCFKTFSLVVSILFQWFLQNDTYVRRGKIFWTSGHFWQFIILRHEFSFSTFYTDQSNKYFHLVLWKWKRRRKSLLLP